jgi:single-strand DNA-binding protein
MASYNRVIMMGNLTRDPEHKQLASGQAVCRFGLASNRQFKNRQTGSMVQEVCFIDVDVWGPQAEHCKQYLQKGRAVLVEGRIKLDSWQDNDGTKRSKHTIVADRVTFLGGASQTDEVESEVAQGSNDGMMAARQDAPFVAPKVKAAKKVESTATGEINFKDEAPFEDDLPF